MSAEYGRIGSIGRPTKICIRNEIDSTNMKFTCKKTNLFIGSSIGCSISFT